MTPNEQTKHIAMTTNTSKDKAREYANKMGSFVCYDIAYNAYMAGANQLLASPIASRLTDAEKKAIRRMHADTFPNDIDQNLTGMCIMLSLEEIFGKEFFKENYK